MLKAAADAETRGWKASEVVNTKTLETLKANGMQIMAMPLQLKTDLTKVGDTMLKEWLEKAGTEGQTIVDNYRK